MTLEEQIDRDLKIAMKAGESEKVSVLRMVKAALKNKQIELGRALADEDTTAILQKEVKQRRDSIRQFQDGGRAELAAKEEQELLVLQGYLPEQLGDEELAAMIEAAIADTGATTLSEMGKVIGTVMASAQGRADGGRVSAAVKARLQS